MAATENDIAKKLGVKRVLIPVIIGLGVAAWLLVSNLGQERFEFVGDGMGQYVWEDANDNGKVDSGDEAEFRKEIWGPYEKRTNADFLREISWTWHTTFWMAMALVMMAIRDIAYMYRIRILTDKQLSWRQSFRVILIWEFASAITPSVVGGAGVAMFIVNREGISMGKSTALVMITALMDELFYITIVPIVILTVGMETLFPNGGVRSFLGLELDVQVVFWIGYFFIIGLTTFITLAVFFGPNTFKKILVSISRLPILRRWKSKFARTGDEIITTSTELKSKPFGYWFKSILATYFSWTARYWVVNCIILAFTSLSFSENMLVYARQLVMWVILLISPTPGSSGVAEVAFSEFFHELIPVALIVILALTWRLVSYYPYLFIGAIMLPGWLRKTSKKK